MQPMNNENHFANDLKRLRKEAGLRQIDVARMLGHASSDRISHWEKGLAVPRLVNLFKLSVILGTSSERLYHDLYQSIAKNHAADGKYRIESLPRNAAVSQH